MFSCLHRTHDTNSDVFLREMCPKATESSERPPGHREEVRDSCPPPLR
jgi:hypothetical protein